MENRSEGVARVPPRVGEMLITSYRRACDRRGGKIPSVKTNVTMDTFSIS